MRCGGGVNHRMSLSDAALIKDNHVVAAGGVAEAFTAVRAEFPDLVEVEVDTLDQIAQVLAAGADLILLDNFTPERDRGGRRAGRGPGRAGVLRPPDPGQRPRVRRDRRRLPCGGRAHALLPDPRHRP